MVFVVIGLIHLYLWKRLVRDPFGKGRASRIGAVAAVVFALLIPATLIGTRAGFAKWLAWPGYLWLALMFYLLVVLAVLEIPRLIANLWLGAREKRTGGERPNSDETADHGDPRHAATAATSSAPAKASPGTPAAGTPAAGTPAAGTPAAGTTTAGTTTVGTPAAGTTTAGTPAAGTTTAGTPAARTTTAGTTTAAAEATAPAPAGTPPMGPDGRPGVDRRLVLARGAAIFAGLTAAGVTGYGVKTATGGPRLDRVQIPIAKLPRGMDGTRLAVVSDIHLGPLTGVRHTERIVDLINSVDADVVCVVGDLVDGSVAELGRVAAPLAGIRSRRGAYFVTGNHEYYSGYKQWVDEVARLGVRPLRNERLELDGLDLAGVNDLGGTEFGDGPDYERALGNREPDRPVVLMAHQPVVARDVSRYGVDLQVSGHTHGGQMVPFNLLVKLEQPVVSGYGKVDGVPVYVTNGAGFWGPPVRVGAPPQVTLIELRAP
ncbi:metallophosphoesterase [Actinoplanes sp. NPDC049316]|uniref:metallophosphoesterase n=1 Tax=Actinoplanes sp. NPDC049316 TaxID=3154727 RepID=UPI00342B4F5C